jgi:HSP90 family molecular chaperone
MRNERHKRGITNLSGEEESMKKPHAQTIKDAKGNDVGLLVEEIDSYVVEVTNQANGKSVRFTREQLTALARDTESRNKREHR